MLHHNVDPYVDIKAIQIKATLATIFFSFSDVIRKMKEACAHVCDGTRHLSHAVPSLSHRVIAMREPRLAIVLLAITA